MNVVLVNPPVEYEIIGNNPSFIDEERGYNPPLGLLYIASYLELHTNHNVTIIDSQLEQLGSTDLREKFSALQPDVVGVEVMTFTLLDVIAVIKQAKATNPDCIVVLGGPHAHLFPDETAAIPEVDFVVIGEGEVTFKELLECIGDSVAVRRVLGLVYSCEGAIVHTGQRPLIDDLDELPFPARHLTPYMNYTSLLAKRSPVTTMFTSRGCPYRCSFCDRPHLGKKFRRRSASNVVDEMEECVYMGIHEILIYDDTFTVDRKRVLDVCAEINRRQLDVSWDIRTRVDNVDDEMMEALAGAKCERIHFGVESGTDKILKVLNKDISLEQAKSTFRKARQVGISTLAYFMIGAPTETIDDIKATIKYMQDLDPDFVHITILCPFPGTAIYEQALKTGIISRDVWQDFAISPNQDFIPPYWEEELSRDDLLCWIKKAYKSFYVRPTYIIGKLRSISSKEELAKKVRAGLKVLFWK